MYDFKQCKRCGTQNGAAKYQLKNMTLYACSDCDFHYIDALDTIKHHEQPVQQLTARDQDYIESQLPQNTRQLTLNLHFVQQHIKVAESTCLDIGCGAGVFPSLLVNHGAQVSAIEPHPLFRQFCAKKFNITPHHQLIDSAYWQQGFIAHFDIVTMWDTLEHVNFPAETIAAISRVIKPQGYLFLDTPSRDSFTYRLSEWSYRFSRGRNPLMLNSLYSPKRFGHKQIFTKNQLWQLLEQHDLTVIGQSALHQAKNKHVLVCQKNIKTSVKTNDNNPADSC